MALKDISSIKLQGANFASIGMLPLLDYSDGKYSKISLLYGRNGAGKSTIAKAFRMMKGETVPPVTTAIPLNASNQTIIFSDTERSSIFVFDEDFITSNVRIEGNGLGSIVMLGEQADLSTQIEKAEAELKEAEKLVKTTSDTLSEYQTHTNPKSPHFYNNKIYGALQRDDGWAGRDSKARGLRQNSRVTDDTYKRFIGLSPTKTRDELIVAFDSKMKELETAKSGSATITSKVPSIPELYSSYSVSSANELIKQKIEKPELTDREKYLLSLATSGGTSELQSRIDFLSDKDKVFCPYCLQDLTQDYKNNLIKRIQKVLTDELKQHQDQLKAAITVELSLDLCPYSALSSYQSCCDLLKEINDILTTNNALIQTKIDDSYTPIVDQELSEISKKCMSLAEALKALEEERNKHNSKAAATQPIIDALVSINNQIAYYDVIEFSKQYDIQVAEMATAKDAFDNAVTARDLKKEQLEDLNGQRKRIDIAIDIINNGLKYIFFAENRLSIERDGDFYKLLSNGKPVIPKNVSVGERNIIGLCYFFTSIMTEKNKDTAYNDEYLIVIDDPVSSYDFENKVGILSFLKYKLSQFLDGNVNSRAIIMTHDLLTFFDMEKICQELSSEWKKCFTSQATKYNLWELKECSLKRFEYKKRQEYTELLKLVYEYGCGSAGEYDIVIGNIMRQSLEAFATFEYRQGIAEVSTNDSLLSGMCDEHKAYFKNLMYRIVLNSGSHREEQTQSMEIDFLSVISESEKRRTAKEIICFIYLLNKAHVIAHLGDVSSIVDTWCDDVKKRAALI